MSRRYQKVLAPIVILLIIVFVWQSAGIFFETNDDKCITEILSGVLTGEPEARVGYVSYPLALPISLLYRVTDEVPWYGLFLIFSQVLAYVGILESVYSRCRNIVETVLGTVAVAAFVLTGLYLLGSIQFTSTAALVAAAGYFCLLVQPEGREKWIWFFGLELISCCLRSKAMLMMQPMGVLTTAGVMLVCDGTFSFRRYAAKAGRIPAVLAAVLLITALGNAIGNKGEGWAEYMRFNACTETLFDYGDGMPPYEDVKEILDRHQVTKEDYEALRYYIILDWVVSPACAEELVAYVEDHREKTDFKDLLEAFRENMLENSYWGLNKVLAVLWVAVILGIIVWRRFPYCGGALCLLGGKMFSWGYLLYKGRFPLRISIPLLVGEEILLLALVFCIGDFGRKSLLGKDAEDSRIRKYFGILFFSCFFAVCLLSGKYQYGYIRETNSVQRILMERTREIEAYCSASPEKRYILDMLSVTYCNVSALETQIYQNRNYVISGNWYSDSPGVRKYNAQYFHGAEEIYYIVSDDGTGEEHIGLRWLTQKTGISPKLSDSFTTSYGGEFLVWCYNLTEEIAQAQLVTVQSVH